MLDKQFKHGQQKYHSERAPHQSCQQAMSRGCQAATGGNEPQGVVCGIIGMAGSQFTGVYYHRVSGIIIGITCLLFIAPLECETVIIAGVSIPGGIGKKAAFVFVNSYDAAGMSRRQVKKNVTQFSKNVNILEFGYYNLESP